MKKVALNCAWLLCAFLLTSSTADSSHRVLVPPNVNFRGLSLEEWNILALEWQIAELLGDPSGLSDTVRGVRFLPISDGAEAEFEVTLVEGTPFVSSPFAIWGELYDDGSQDSPDDPIISEFLETSDIETILNGEVVLQGTAADFTRRLFGPTFFDEPIPYNEPQPRGPGLNAVAALFAFGVGAVYQPLPVGEHTLEQTVDSDLFGVTRITYNITVVPPIQRFQAICTPDQEVPPVTESTARSVANLTVLNFPTGSVLITTRIDRRLTTPYRVSHIHLAPAGVTGPPVILYDAPILEIVGLLAVSADVHTSEDLIGPLAGQTLHDLVREIEAGNTYLNVHTEMFPAGETRGQIE
jgi:hypothetical protein